MYVLYNVSETFNLCYIIIYDKFHWLMDRTALMAERGLGYKCSDSLIYINYVCNILYYVLIVHIESVYYLVF